MMGLGKHSANPEENTTKTRKNKVLRELVEILVLILVAVFVTTVLRAFVIDQYQIPTGSMEPTIEVGDRLFAEKVSYHYKQPTPGDIVTFYDPTPGNEGRILIKRCIAVEGQAVELVDGRVVVDGLVLDEPYTHGKESNPLGAMPGVTISYPFTIPAGSIWVMGDNRTNSLDSRYFGSIPDDLLIGRALFRSLPLDRFGAIE